MDDIHPNDEHLYGNGLSIVLYLKYGNQSILIAGNITPEVFERVIDGNSSVERRYTEFKYSLKSNSTWQTETFGQPTMKNFYQNMGYLFWLPHIMD